MPMAFDADGVRALLDQLAETILEPARRL